MTITLILFKPGLIKHFNEKLSTYTLVSERKKPPSGGKAA
jgi:hypothetical protein